MILGESTSHVATTDHVRTAKRIERQRSRQDDELQTKRSEITVRIRHGEQAVSRT